MRGRVDRPLAPIIRRVRAWDLAATNPNPDNKDPDFTVGILVWYCPPDSYWYRGRSGTVPPLVGPWLIKRTMHREAIVTSEGIERLAAQP